MHKLLDRIIQLRIRGLERHLYEHRQKLFKKQHRDTKRKRTFSLVGSFKVGVGSTQVGNLQHVGKKRGHIKHPFLNTAAFVLPVTEQALSPEVKQVYTMAMRILRYIDPHYAAGEVLVNFSWLSSPTHYVRRHTDTHDIAPQYALSVGNFEGATLRVHDADGDVHDLDTRWSVAHFDGRLPHEVVVDPAFNGDRFTIIWYKNYDSRLSSAAPILDTPHIAWSFL